MQELMLHQLIIEASSSVIENSNEDDVTAALNRQFRAILHEDVDEPLAIFVNSMYLKQEYQSISTTFSDNQTFGEYSPSPFPPIFIGLPLPSHILQQLDGSYTELKHDPNSISVFDEILSQIHPSLLQLRVCGIFRSKQRSGQETYCNGRGLMNAIDLILLTTHENFSTGNDQEMRMTALSAITEDVNGEAFICAPSCSIQIVKISQTHFVTQRQMRAVTAVVNSTAQRSTGSKSLGIPLCPVCRYRIEPQRFGLPPPKESQRCSHAHESHCENWQFLAPWSFPTYCEACHLLQERLKLSGAQPFLTPSSDQTLERNALNVKMRDRLNCFKCSMEETLWVCLTCGIIGCGRYSSGHAEQHYIEMGHTFSLELATQRIWDYETGSFVHRDDLLNCPFIQRMLGAVNRAAYHSAAICGGNCIGDRRVLDGFGPATKKTIMVGDEYEALLQSALEDQTQHFEGEIAHLQADLAADAVNKSNLSSFDMVEIERLKIETKRMRVGIENLSRKLLEVQAQEAGHRAKANALLREQSITKQLLEKIRDESTFEQKVGKEKIEELEQQVSDLTSNLRMRQQFTQNRELNEAQIYGTGNQISGGRRKGKLRSHRK